MVKQLPRSVLSFSILLSISGITPAIAADSNENIKKLETIVITASGSEQNVADAPASISVITAEELQKKAYTDVIDAVKNIPGVSVSGGGNNQDILIRGMGAGYTKYLVNGRSISAGRSINTNGTDGGKIGAYLPPIDQIERIEVVRGPMSSLYGSEAMGGVINIITKKASSDTWGGSITPQYTKSANDISNDEYSVSAFLTGPLIQDKLSLSLDGAFQGNDESDLAAKNPDAVGEANKSDGAKTEKKVRKLGTELTWNVNDENDLTLRYDTIKQEYTSTAGKSKPLTGIASSDATTYSKINKNVYMIGHQGAYDNLVTNTYFQREDTEKVQDKSIEERFDIFNTQSSYNIGSHVLTFGGQYQKEKFTNESNGLIGTVEFAVREADRWQGALFLEDEWNIANFILTTGIRYNDDELFGGEFTPRIYGVYHLTDGFTLKGGVSTGYKQPNIAQVTEGFGQGTGGSGSPAPHPRALILGNPDLDPEKSVSYEFGFNYSDSDNGLFSSLMIFQTDYKDKISESRICDNGGDRQDPSTWTCRQGANNYLFLSSYENIQDAEIKGIEFTLDYDLLDNLTANTSYTYTKSEQKSGDFKGQPLNKIPKNMLNIGFDYDISDDWNAWTQYNYRGKTSDYLSRVSMSQGTPGYGTFDAGVVFHATDTLSLKAGVYNLANKEITNDEYGAVLDGRRYTFGMNVRF
ncbi:colicin FY TonB-dependent receptor YuiR [Acinetobacter puyangensis]|uniref:Outer membrane receptor for ferrienterochelin and colicins n=1 Tax=Acinetobacter puyangensis TaxID=1096779 RepID=A0A240ECH0_9GAMM|nr:TonB-dependent receptor [Acinetobacter puyangensis]SNX46246.1 outer membrane receptor for ferrienterochelin and colicins [Acinetobacter puyangensis]